MRQDKRLEKIASKIYKSQTGGRKSIYESKTKKAIESRHSRASDKQIEAVDLLKGSYL